MSVLKDCYIENQENLIGEKLSMIRFLNKDMAFMLQLKEKARDPELIFQINCMIQDFQVHVCHLGRSIENNRRLISEREERLRNNLVDRNEVRNRPETGTRRGSIQQPSLVR